MTQLNIEIDYDAYYPRGEMQATVSWTSEAQVNAAQLRVVWSTAGKGDRDLKVVHTVWIDAPQQNDRRDVSLTLPWGPYSFSGKLISLIWALELFVFPENASARKEFVLGPDAREVLIGTAKSG